MFAVQPKYDCPHVKKCTVIPTNITSLCKGICIKPCVDCDDKSENWICVTCHQTFCSRYVKGHFMQHHLNNEEHSVGISLSDLSVWCYSCESYVIDHNVDKFLNQIHIDKFGTTRNEQSKKRKEIIEIDSDSEQEDDEEVEEIEAPIDFCQGFVLPTEEEKVQALGERKNKIPPEYVAHASLFGPIPKPTHQDDWLAQFVEKQQSFTRWFNRRPNIIDEKRNIIYLVGMGEFVNNGVDLMEHIRDYTAAYYYPLDVKILPSLTIEINGKETSVDASDFIKEAPGLEDAKYIYPIRTRHCHEYDEDKAWKNEKQYKTSDVLSMLADLVPEDAFCMCSVTMCDLFAGKTDSFTGGMAAGGSRVGVFSMCRYDPSFRVRRKKRKTSNKLSADQLTLLRRGCKVVVHEIGHMFNIGHCVYYSCCMNGSGHLLEDYAQPIHLCPIDLKKIQVATGCDVWERYRQLLKFYDKYEMNEESEWVRSRFKLADVKE